MTRTGGCLCGAIRYQVVGAPDRVFGCFCHDCQKAGGSAFHWGAVFQRANFQLLQGELAAYVSMADSGREITRSFCRTCGSGIHNEPLTVGDAIVLRVGTLDDPSTLAPSYELYAQTKPDWITLRSATQSNQRMRR